jgi:hypothetical protein
VKRRGDVPAIAVDVEALLATLVEARKLGARLLRETRRTPEYLRGRELEGEDLTGAAFDDPVAAFPWSLAGDLDQLDDNLAESITALRDTLRRRPRRRAA